MPYYHVMVVNEKQAPMRYVDVEAIDYMNWPEVYAVENTGAYGVATFNIPRGTLCYFRPRAKRSSGTAAGIIPEEDRAFIGAIYVQWATESGGGEGLMNAYYVVDSEGQGTHTTLFGADGALEAAIARGQNTETFIWICATHQETRTSTHSISAMPLNQRIHIMGGGPQIHNLTFDFNGPAITWGQDAAEGTEIIWENVGLSRAPAKSGPFVQLSGSTDLPEMVLRRVDFGGGGTWTYLWDFDAGTYTSMSGILMEGCTGAATAIFYLSTNTTGLYGPFIMRSCQMTLGYIEYRDSNTDVDLGNSIIIQDCVLTISGYALRIAYFTDNDQRPCVIITGNSFIYNGTGDFIDLGTAATTNLGKIVINDNVFHGKQAGCRFLHLDIFSGTVRALSVAGNVLRGPGSGTAIQLDEAIPYALILNSYYGWTTNIGGSNAPAMPSEWTGVIAPANAQYVVMTATADLTAERVLTAGDAISVTDGGANNPVTLALSLAGQSRGDLIVRGAAAWSRLAIGGSGTFLASDGTDPAWRTLLESDIPAAIARDAEVAEAIANHAALPDVHHAAFTSDDHLAIGDDTPHHPQITVQDEGTPLTQRATLNFTGAGVTATDDPENDRTNITIPGGGGGMEVHDLGGAWHSGVDDYTTTLGLAKLSIDDADFYLDLATLVFDAGPDCLRFVRASNQFEFEIGGVDQLQLDASGLRVANYARIGSTSTPANTAAGDLTIGRLSLGEDVALSATLGWFAHLTGTFTDTASGAVIGFGFNPRIAPASNSSSEFRALVMELLADHGTVTLSTLRSAYLAPRIRGSGAISTSVGVFGCGAMFDSQATGSSYSVTTLQGGEFRSLARSSGSTPLTASYARALRISSPSGLLATDAITNMLGVVIDNQGTALFSPSAVIGLDIAAQTGPTGATLGIRNAAQTAFTPSTTQTLSASSTILANATLIKIATDGSGNIVLTSTPTIAAGAAGQVLVILMMDSSRTITLQDESVLSGSNLRLFGGENRTLAYRDVLILAYDTALGDWVEVAYANNAWNKPTYAVTNVTPDRAYDANATTLDEIADVLGTLISDLQALKIIG